MNGGSRKQVVFALTKMRFSAPMRQMLNAQALDALRKTISKTVQEATPHINAVKRRQIEIFNDRFLRLNNWYMRVVGLDKVKLSQDRVSALQEQLLDVQNKRREVSRQLSDVRQQSIALQDEIHKVKRQEDLERFLDLMKKETDILKLEKTIMKTFHDYDQTERELFTAFTNAIRDSHERQRAQMEYTKYFGIILSIVGSFLGFMYSTLRKEHLKTFLDERLRLMGPLSDPAVTEILRSNKTTLDEVIKSTKVLNDIVATLEKRSKQEIKIQPKIIPVENTSLDIQKKEVVYLSVVSGAILVWLLLKGVSG